MKQHTYGTGSFGKRTDTKKTSYYYQVVVKFKDGTKKRKKFYGKSKTEAYNKYLKFIDSDQVLQQNTKDGEVFADYANRWLKLYRREVDKNTFDRKYETLKNNVYPYIGNIPIQDLTQYDISDMLTQLDTRGLSISTQRKAYQAVNQVCKDAVGIYLKENPCIKVKAPATDKSKQSEIIYLNDDELELFKTELFSKNKASHQPKYKNRWAIYLQLQTGMRVGELCALQLQDIFTDANGNKFIHISRTAGETRNYDKSGKVKIRTVIKEAPKTKASNRNIPVNTEADRSLNELIQMNNVTKPEDLILQSLHGGIMQISAYIKSYNRVITNAGISKTKCGSHTLRRTFGSKLFEQGLDLTMVSKILGHNDISTTNKWYVAITAKKQTEELAKFKSI